MSFVCVIVSIIVFMLSSLNEYLGVELGHDDDSFRR